MELFNEVEYVHDIDSITLPLCLTCLSSVSPVYKLSKLRKTGREMSQNVKALATFTGYYAGYPALSSCSNWKVSLCREISVRNQG